MTARIILSAPSTAKRGEIITINALIAHAMESGFRHTTTGVPIPRDIITQLVATYNGAEIFRAEFFPAVAANPFISFDTIATESGVIAFQWAGDNGFSATKQVKITVT